MGSRVFIGGLPMCAEERDVEQFFRSCGRLREVLLKDRFGFVEFEDYRDAQCAVSNLNGKELCGVRVKVKLAYPYRRGCDDPNCRDRNDSSRSNSPTTAGYRLVVENLSSAISWQDLKDLMRQAGKVTYVDVYKSSRQGMVEFASYSDLKEAMKRFDGILLNSRQIKLVDVSDISGSPHLSSTQSRSRNSSDSLTEMPVSTPKSPSVRQRSYPTSKLSEEGRHLVVVSHTVNGPHKFAIQLTSEAEAYGKLRKAIESSLRPFPGIPKKGDPCIALCLTGKAFHRCLITAVDDSGPTYTVYFIDIGTECQIGPDFIRDISNELLACPPFAYQVSLAGVEEVAQLIGLNDIFSSLLKSAGYLLAQVTKDKVHLYDHSGRNFIDVLTSIKLNLMATILGIATNGPSVASPSPPLTKEMIPPKRILALDDSLRDISALPDLFPTESDLRTENFSASSVAMEISPRKNNASKLDEILLNGKFTQGQLISSVAGVSHIVSVNEVWIQLDPLAAELIMEEIAVDVHQLEHLEPASGIYCLCLHKKDKRWYRAVVHSVQEDCASVTFIDYGIPSIVNTFDFKVLPPHLSQQPDLALKCALDGAGMKNKTSSTDSKCLSIIVDSGFVSVVFVHQTLTQLFVRLFDDSGTDLNEKMGLLERNVSDFSEKH